MTTVRRSQNVTHSSYYASIGVALFGNKLLTYSRWSKSTMLTLLLYSTTIAMDGQLWFGRGSRQCNYDKDLHGWVSNHK